LRCVAYILHKPPPAAETAVRTVLGQRNTTNVSQFAQAKERKCWSCATKLNRGDSQGGEAPLSALLGTFPAREKYIHQKRTFRLHSGDYLPSITDSTPSSPAGSAFFIISIASIARSILSCGGLSFTALADSAFFPIFLSTVLFHFTVSR